MVYFTPQNALRQRAALRRYSPGLERVAGDRFVSYILVDFDAWRDSFEDVIPPRFRDPFGRLFDEVGRILQVSRWPLGPGS
jgi:hypothetical protein